MSSPADATQRCLRCAERTHPGVVAGTPLFHATGNQIRRTQRHQRLGIDRRIHRRRHDTSAAQQLGQRARHHATAARTAQRHACGGR